jgi:hypothetical protein
MAETRKRYGADFKFRVAMEAAKGQKTLNELASEHGVHANPLCRETSNLTEMSTFILAVLGILNLAVTKSVPRHIESGLQQVISMIKSIVVMWRGTELLPQLEHTMAVSVSPDVKLLSTYPLVWK